MRNARRWNRVKYIPIFQCMILSFLILSCTNPTGTSEKNLKNKPQSGEIYTEEHRELTPSHTKNKNYVRGQILIKFRGGTDEQAIETIQRELSLKTIRVVHRPNLFLMKILDGTSVEEIIDRLKTFAEVAYAEPNYIVTVH